MNNFLAVCVRFKRSKINPIAVLSQLFALDMKHDFRQYKDMKVNFH